MVLLCRYIIMSNIKLALAIRGHIRDSFTNNRIKRFCKELCNKYDTDIYIHTCNKFEATDSHRYEELNKKYKKKTANKELFENYFKDCSNNIKNIMIDDDKSIKHIGETKGKICEGSCPRLCWKNYWYGKYRVFEAIKNSNIPYNLVLNIRIDNFVNKYSKKSNIIETIIYEKLEQVLKSRKDLTFNKLYFFSNKAMYGIDNCYLGPVNVMYKLGKYFHEDLDKITTKYNGRYVTSQEWLVLFEANTVNDEFDTSILMPHQVRRRKNKEIQKIIEERARKRRIYNRDLRQKATLIQRQRKMMDTKTREVLLDRMKRRKDARRSRILALRQAAKAARERRNKNN